MHCTKPPPFLQQQRGAVDPLIRFPRRVLLEHTYLHDDERFDFIARSAICRCIPLERGTILTLLPARTGHLTS